MKPTEIILHCSATKEGVEVSSAEIEKWHKARGFKKIGYHYIIALDGSIETGRAENEVGAHCKGHNKCSIGVCYIGGLGEDGKPKDTRTPEQKEALFTLVSKLLLKYDLKPDDVHGHYEFANKACPCFTTDTFLKELADWLKESLMNNNN